MEARELMLGNWVKVAEPWADGLLIYKQVDIKLLNRIARDTPCLPLYEPITLTPETLEKAGFKVSITKTCYGLITEDGKLRLSIFNDGRFKIHVDDIPAKVEYLHQLQNLYYSLTGKHLQIPL